MLLNNLDPEVAEHPGAARRLRRLGPGRAESRRAARDRPHAAPAPRGRDAARPERQACRRVPDGRVGAARPHRELAARPALGDLGRVPPARGRGADDVRPDDRRAAGSTSARRGSCRARTRRSPPRASSTSARPISAGGRSSPPVSAGWAARSRSPRRWRARRSSASRSTRVAIERRLETRYLDEVADSLDDGLARVRGAAAEGRALSVGLLGNAATVFPELAARGEHFDLVTDQTAAHDPLTGYVPAEVPFEEAAALRAARPGRVRASRARVDRGARRGDDRVRPRGLLRLRLRQQSAGRGATTRAWATRSHTRASSRRTSGRSSVAGSGRSGGRRSPATRRTSTRSTASSRRSSRTTCSSSAGSSSRRGESPSRGCRRASAGSATATARRPGSRSTSSCARARCRRRS